MGWAGATGDGGGGEQLRKRPSPADGKPTAGDRPAVPEGQWRAKVPLSRRGHRLETQCACEKPTPRATGARPPGWEGRAASPEGTSEASGRTRMRAPWGKCGTGSAALTATQAAIRAARSRGLQEWRRPGRLGTRPAPPLCPRRPEQEAPHTVTLSQ